jgi:hypothetical protein
VLRRTPGWLANLWAHENMIWSRLKKAPQTDGNGDMQRLYPLAQAEKTWRLCARTIRKYAKDGKIDYMITEGVKFRFGVSGYVARKVNRPATAT